MFSEIYNLLTSDLLTKQNKESNVYYRYFLFLMVMAFVFTVLYN